MANLQAALETLSAQFKTADLRLKEVDQKGVDAAGKLDGLAGELTTGNHALGAPAQLMFDGLTSGLATTEGSLSGLEGNLKGLEADAQDRTVKTQAELKAMIEAVNSLSEMVGQVSRALQEERLKTEKGLNDAGQKSQAAFEHSRKKVESLDEFVRKSYLPKLQELNRKTEEERLTLNQTLQNRFLPGLQTSIDGMHRQVTQAVADLTARTKAFHQAHGKKAEAATTDLKGATERVVSDLAQTSQDTNKVTVEVGNTVTEGLNTENQAEQDLVLEADHFNKRPTGILPKTQNIPVRLEEVLKKARVIR